jgi:transposase
MGIFYVGIDLAKNVFAVHGVNEAGKPELIRPSVPRARLHELIASLGRSTKDGDAYLRKMLILGARAVLAAKNKTDAISRWATALEERRG